MFSALVHDVDHRGVPNTQLIIEDPTTAAMYKNKSVAEQISVDLAWTTLMDSRFKHLQGAIFTSQSELERFRALVVNSVMATDIMDRDLKELRNARWIKAFAESVVVGAESEKDAVDRKATIVIEHIIQASDIAHTMQHWHIYKKWNERYVLYPFICFLLSFDCLLMKTSCFGVLTDCLGKCTRPSKKGGQKRTQASFGTKERLVSLTFTLSLWPRS